MQEGHCSTLHACLAVLMQTRFQEKHRAHIMRMCMHVLHRRDAARHGVGCNVRRVLGFCKVHGLRAPRVGLCQPLRAGAFCGLPPVIAWCGRHQECLFCWPAVLACHFLLPAEIFRRAPATLVPVACSRSKYCNMQACTHAAMLLQQACTPVHPVMHSM